jgi:hypothetical protein
MGIEPRQRPVNTALTALLVVSAVLVLFDLARVVFLDLTGSDRPSDRRCVDLWNGPANQTNRSLVRGRSFPLATVRGAGPNKAGQPGCGVLLRERQDGPWLSFGAALTEAGVYWDPGVSGVRYGTDSPSGAVDDTPNATLQADGTLILSDR